MPQGDLDGPRACGWCLGLDEAGMDVGPGLVKCPEEEEERVYPSVTPLGVVGSSWVLLHFPCSVTWLSWELQEVTQVTQVTVSTTSWASSCGSRAATSVSPVPVSCLPCCSCRCGRSQSCLVPIPSCSPELEEPLISAAACLASSCVPGARRDACRAAGAGRDEIRGSQCEGAVPALPAALPAHRLCQSSIQSGLCLSCSFPSCLWCQEARE